MDPNRTLSTALAALADWQAVHDGFAEQTDPTELEALTSLAESFEALDGWIRSGGFLPDAWSVEDALQQPEQDTEYEALLARRVEITEAEGS